MDFPQPDAENNSIWPLLTCIFVTGFIYVYIKDKKYLITRIKWLSSIIIWLVLGPLAIIFDLIELSVGFE